MTDDRPIRVLLADDQALFRRAIAALLDAQPDFEVVGEANNGLEGVEEARALRPDIVVLDVEMPIMDGLEAARVIREMSCVRDRVAFRGLNQTTLWGSG